MRLWVAILIPSLVLLQLAEQARSGPLRTEAHPDCLVVGDIHGCLTNLKRVLTQSGVLDEETQSKWIFGNRTVVQVGDLLDRGHDDAAVLTFVQDIMRQAKARGGRWAQVGLR